MKRIENIPEGWEIEELGECICSMKSGMSRLLSDYDIGIPVLRSCNIGEKYPIFTNLKYWYIKDSQGSNTSNYILNDGDLLVNFINSIAQIGKTCIFRKVIDRDCIYTTNILRVIVNDKIISEYLFLLTKTEKYNWFVSTITKPAVNQASFTTKDFRKFNILLPPLAEQKAIAGVLGTWDEAIEKVSKLIELKEKKFKWLLKTLISDQCDDEPRTTQKARKKEKWKKVKLGDLFGKQIIIEKGKPLTKKTMEIGAVPVVAGGKSYAYHAKEPTHNMPTVTVSASGAYAGYIWFHDYPIWASDCNVLFAVSGSTKFLYFALKVLQDRLYALQAGGAQPHVYSKDMKNLMIPWPKPEIQTQIASTLSAAQKEVDLLKQLVEKYKEQKKGLMQKLLTGEWRVAPCSEC